MRKTTSIPPIASGRQKHERGVVLLLGALSLPVLISMMGLGIDASVLYATKTKLQLATDGAAVAAARALSLGTTTAAQASSAQANAINWFDKNFSTLTMGATSITVDTPAVFDDPVQPLIRHVQVTARATAPSFFMRFWGRTGTVINSFSEATRRDSVIMMVLDRSGSMNSGGACAEMVSAAKKFTSIFSAGRDRIGLITFNMASNIASAPTTNFLTTIGSTTSTGALLDNLSCNGGTGTPQATILGYNELYKVALPGALNVLLLFTDGEPNVVTFDFRGGTTVNTGVLKDSTNCQDGSSRSFNSSASPRGNFNTSTNNWTGGWNFGTGSYLANISSGPIAGTYADSSNSWAAFNYKSTSVNSTSDDSAVSVSGCSFGTSGSSLTNNIEWLPDTDIYGTPLELSGFYSLTRSTYDGASRITANNFNAHYAAYNASANAANTARTTRNLPSGVSFPGVYVYCIGLGNVNHQLLQRMANDPNGDLSGNNYYTANASVNTAQPIGTYVYAEDSSRLSQAFGQIASFILRISQ